MTALKDKQDSRWHISEEEHDDIESLNGSYHTVYNNNSTGVKIRTCATKSITRTMNLKPPETDEFDSDWSMPILNNRQVRSIASNVRDYNMNKQQTRLNSLSTTKDSISKSTSVQQKEPYRNPTQTNFYTNFSEQYSRHSILSNNTNSDFSRSTFSKRPLYRDSVLQEKTVVSPEESSLSYKNIYGEGSRSTKRFTQKNKTDVSHTNKVSKDDIARFVKTKLLHNEPQTPKTNVTDVNINKNDKSGDNVFKTPLLPLNGSVRKPFALKGANATYVSPKTIKSVEVGAKVPESLDLNTRENRINDFMSLNTVNNYGNKDDYNAFEYKRAASDKGRPNDFMSLNAGYYGNRSDNNVIESKRAVNSTDRPNLNQTFSAVTLSDSSDDEFFRRRSYFQKKLYEEAKNFDHKKNKRKLKESHEKKISTKKMLKQLLDKKYKKKASEQKYKKYLKKLVEQKFKKYKSRNSKNRRYGANLDLMQTSIDIVDSNKRNRSYNKLKSKKGDLLSMIDKLRSKKYSDTSDTDSSISDKEFEYIMRKLNINKAKSRYYDRDIGSRLQRKANKRHNRSLGDLSSDSTELDSSEESIESEFSIRIVPKKSKKLNLPNRRKSFMVMDRLRTDYYDEPQSETVHNRRNKKEMYNKPNVYEEKQLDSNTEGDMKLFLDNKNATELELQFDAETGSDFHELNSSIQKNITIDDVLDKPSAINMSFDKPRAINMSFEKESVERSIFDDSSDDNMSTLTYNVARSKLNGTVSNNMCVRNEPNAESFEARLSNTEKAIKRSVFVDSSAEKILNSKAIRTDISVDKQHQTTMNKTVKRSIFNGSSDDELGQNEISCEKGDVATQQDDTLTRENISCKNKTVIRNEIDKNSNERDNIKTATNHNETAKSNVAINKRITATNIVKPPKKSITRKSISKPKRISHNYSKNNNNNFKTATKAIEKVPRKSFGKQKSNSHVLTKDIKKITKNCGSHIPVKTNSQKITNKVDLRINMKAKNRNIPRKSSRNSNLLKDVINAVKESAPLRRSLRNSLKRNSLVLEAKNSETATDTNKNKIDVTKKLVNVRNPLPKPLNYLNARKVAASKSKLHSVNPIKIPNELAHKNSCKDKIDSKQETQNAYRDIRNTNKKTAISKDVNKNTAVASNEAITSRRTATVSKTYTHNINKHTAIPKPINKKTVISTKEAINSRKITSVPKNDNFSKNIRSINKNAVISTNINKNTNVSTKAAMNSRKITIVPKDDKCNSHKNVRNINKDKVIPKDINTNMSIPTKQAMNCQKVSTVYKNDSHNCHKDTRNINKNSVISKDLNGISIASRTNTMNTCINSNKEIRFDKQLVEPVSRKDINSSKDTIDSKKNTRSANKKLVISKGSNRKLVNYNKDVVISHNNSDVLSKKSIFDESHDEIENLQPLKDWGLHRSYKIKVTSASTPKKANFLAPVLPKQTNPSVPVLPKQKNPAPVLPKQSKIVTTANETANSVVSFRSKVKSYYGTKSECTLIEGNNGNYTLMSETSTVLTKRRAFHFF